MMMMNTDELYAMALAAAAAKIKVIEYTEPVVICHESDIQDNEMKPYDLDDNTNILLIKQEGNITAIGNKCTHYGAPLHKGVLGWGRVRCPWHGACFNIETGDIEDFPGLDSLPCYQVKVTPEGQVTVRQKLSQVGLDKRVKEMSKRLDEDRTIFLIIGGGVAGGVCAETLRQEGYTGRIVMLCKEKYLPYDRTKISKVLDVKIETIQWREREFYREYNIEVNLGVEAVKVEADKQMVLGSNNLRYRYEKLFIATGCTPKKPEIPGIELGNIFTLRNYNDAVTINKATYRNMHLIFLGASFIVLETAAFFAGKAKTIHIIGRGEEPLEQVLGSRVGKRIRRIYEEHGIEFMMHNAIINIKGNSFNKISWVTLADDTVLPCDVLIVGIGSVYNTSFLTKSGVKLHEDGSVKVDVCLKTSDSNIYAGGDIAKAAIYPNDNKPANVGHYQMAQYHGRIAAINMFGEDYEELEAVPVFFTMLFGKGIRYSGCAGHHSVYIDGDLEEFKFVAYYFDPHNFVRAVASCGRDPIVAAFAELQLQGKNLHRREIEGATNPSGWMAKVLDDRPPSKCKISVECD